MQFVKLVVLALIVGASSEAAALMEALFERGEWVGETGFEYRYFKDPGEDGQSQHALALRLSGEYVDSWNEDQDFLVFRPYLLLDQEDEERTHWDFRELLWTHVGDSWELRSGFTRVFWGKTEFNNVVDVINQQDLVDDDNEKLGQPLINLSLYHDWGLFDFYLLLGFRERTFPGPKGRLRLPLPVDTSQPDYSAGASKNDVDFAFRWQRPLNDYLDMAFSVFSGVSREPWYSFELSLDNLFEPELTPNYFHMDQFGLELEYLYEQWGVKFEGVSVRSSKEDYQAAVLGLEYGIFNFFKTGADVRLIAEYLYDSRDGETPGYLEHDLAIGGHVLMNDEHDTMFQGGLLWDPQTDEKALQFEAERRLGSNFKLELRATTLLERATPQLEDQTIAAIDELLDSPLVSDSLNYQQIIRFIGEVIDAQALGDLLNNPDIVGTLQQLQRITATSRKLSLRESDDYVELRLTYFY